MIYRRNNNIPLARTDARTNVLTHGEVVLRVEEMRRLLQLQLMMPRMMMLGWLL